METTIPQLNAKQRTTSFDLYHMFGFKQICLHFIFSVGIYLNINHLINVLVLAQIAIATCLSNTYLYTTQAHTYTHRHAYKQPLIYSGKGNYNNNKMEMANYNYKQVPKFRCLEWLQRRTKGNFLSKGKK